MFSGGETDCCPHGAWRSTIGAPAAAHTAAGTGSGGHQERLAHKIRQPTQHAGTREAPGLGSGRHTGSGWLTKYGSRHNMPAPGKRQHIGSGGHETSCHPKTKKADCRNSRPSVTAFPQLSVLERRLVRNGELLTSLGTTGRQHLASVGRSHTLTETMLIDSLPARGLVCSLHCHSCIVFIVLDYFTDCKSTTKKLSAKIFPENISSGSGEKRRILPIFIEK